VAGLGQSIESAWNRRDLIQDEAQAPFAGPALPRVSASQNSSSASLSLLPSRGGSAKRRFCRACASTCAIASTSSAASCFEAGYAGEAEEPVVAHAQER